MRTREVTVTGSCRSSEKVGGRWSCDGREAGGVAGWDADFPIPGRCLFPNILLKREVREMVRKSLPVPGTLLDVPPPQPSGRAAAWARMSVALRTNW